MSVWSSIGSYFGFGPSDAKKGKQVITGGGGKTAKAVTYDSAMTVSAVFAATRLLAETVASLPLKMYEIQTDGTRKEITNHELIKLLKFRPNRRQTRIEFFEQLMTNLVSNGNAYVLRGFLGKKLVSLQVINSGNITPELMDDGSIIYCWRRVGLPERRLTEAEVWHIRLFGNGITGMSPLANASKSIGVAISGDDKITNLMANGAKPTGTLTSEQWPNKEQRDSLREELNTLMNGDETEISVLGGGMKWTPISLSPQDLELLATRRYSLEEIARIYGVPSVLINDTSASTVWGSGIEQLISGFYKFNLRPYLEKIELSMLINLVPVNDWEKYEFEMDADAILRGSLTERVKAHQVQILSSQLTPNEARKMEGRAPAADGDRLLAPANMTTLENLGKIVPLQSKADFTDANNIDLAS